MQKLMTASGHFSFTDRLEDLRGRLTWAEFLARHKEQLESIADIIRLDILWGHSYFMKAHPLSLYLKYTGGALDHKEAAADLARIMETLHCVDLHLRVLSSGSSAPEGEYRGECRLGKTRLTLRLRVKWLPDGCTVHVSSHTSRVHATVRSYSVYCQR